MSARTEASCMASVMVEMRSDPMGWAEDQRRALADCQRPEVVAAARAEWDALPDMMSAKQEAAAHYAANRERLDALWANRPNHKEQRDG